MRTLATLAAIGALLQLQASQPSSFVTVAQRDVLRASAEPPSVDVSADGRHVAFVSYAKLAPGDTDAGSDVYVLDRETGAATLESLPSQGNDSAVWAAHPRLSGDGRYLVYEVTGLIDGATVRSNEVMLRDRVLGTTRSVTAGGSREAPNGHSRAPAISADGRVVAFASSATNLVPGPDANGAEEDVYLFEVATAAVRRVSLDAGGAQPAIGASFAPTLSGDGRCVAFASTANLDRAPTVVDRTSDARLRGTSAVFLRDLGRNVITRIGLGPRGQAANGSSWSPALTPDCRHVAFVSRATNLVPRDNNRSSDVFVYEVMARSIAIISQNAKEGAGNGASFNPVISADGRYVAFQSEGSNLICARRCAPSAEDINLLSDVFILDRQAGIMIRVSADASSEWMEASGGPALDASGRVLAFSSRHPIDAQDAANDFDLFIRSPSSAAQR